jgi:hypothetical protein
LKGSGQDIFRTETDEIGASLGIYLMSALGLTKLAIVPTEMKTIFQSMPVMIARDRSLIATMKAL